MDGELVERLGHQPGCSAVVFGYLEELRRRAGVAEQGTASETQRPAPNGFFQGRPGGPPARLDLEQVVADLTSGPVSVGESPAADDSVEVRLTE